MRMIMILGWLQQAKYHLHSCKIKAEYKSSDFATFEVRKLGKTIPLTFQKSCMAG